MTWGPKPRDLSRPKIILERFRGGREDKKLGFAGACSKIIDKSGKNPGSKRIWGNARL
jgi:hypothetical protein